MSKSPTSTVGRLKKRVAKLTEELEAEKKERHRLGVVLGSIGEVVELGWRHGRKPCPFCQSVFMHRDTCYLADNAGRMLLAEYEVIEKQRDALLAERERGTGEESETPVRSLKSRLRGSDAVLP